MAEGARLESVYTVTGIGGSNPPFSAILYTKLIILFNQYLNIIHVTFCSFST